MKNFIRAFLSLFLVFIQVHIAFAQTAALLPNAIQQFFDNNGNPLSSGYVYTYTPSTLTPKTTWQDANKVTPNTNPIRLDAGGKATIYGDGIYRQIVKDRNSNTIWDGNTYATGVASAALVGDGNLVGTILPWSGFVAPNQYVFAYGQELSRTTYSALFTAITQTQNVSCTSGSPILTNVSDTTQIPIGGFVEVACLAPGTTVISKTSTSVTVSANASVNTTTTGVFFAWGNGDGSTTFNVPDLRGRFLPGRDNMGGTAASRLTSTFFANASAIGATGGSQSTTLVAANLPSGQTVNASGLSVNLVNATNVINYSGTYTNVTSGGAKFGLDTSPTTVNITGSISGTLPLPGSSTAFSRIPAAVTVNYVIKVLPDTNASVASGVASLGGMTGTIACGSGLVCTGNVISTLSSAGVINTGTAGQLAWYGGTGTTISGNPNSTISSGALTLGVTGSAVGQLKLSGTTTGTATITAQSAAGTPSINVGTNSGTLVASATAPLVVNATTGNLTITGAPLTKTDDTNVTLTLGGTPATSLLAATSLTLGWTGQLGLTRGGTNASLTASSGGIVYSTSTALAILAGDAVGGKIVQSGAGGGAPSWSNATYPSSTTANRILFSSSGNTVAEIDCSTANRVLRGGAPPSCGQLVAGDVTTNTLTNSTLAQMNAVTLKGNATASLANASDFTISGLTQETTPDTTNDMLLILDVSTTTFKRISINTITSAGVAGVSSIAGNTGAFTLSTGITNSVNDIRLDKATASNYYAATSNKAVTADVIYPSETTTTFGATTTFDFDTFINTAVTLTGNITTQTLSNIRAGKSGTITFIQDGTGSRTTVWNSNFKFAGGTTPTLTTTASAVDVLTYACRSTSFCTANLLKDVK